MPKLTWKTLVLSRVTLYHEKQMRLKAQANWKLCYLNVQTLGLSGKPHLVLRNVLTTREVVKLRAHLKLLTGDFLSHELLSRERGSSPRCRICPSDTESTQHIISECSATSDTRQRLYPELLNLIASIQPGSHLLYNNTPPNILTQFILDPTSLNLSNGFRISPLHPRVNELFSFSRDWCYAITNHRNRLLKALKESS